MVFTSELCAHFRDDPEGWRRVALRLLAAVRYRRVSDTYDTLVSSSTVADCASTRWKEFPMPCKSFFMFPDETNQGERQLIYDIRCRGN